MRIKWELFINLKRFSYNQSKQVNCRHPSLYYRLAFLPALYTGITQHTLQIDRPESNALKILPKYFQEFPKFFTHYALSVFLLCLHYAPRLATFVAIILEHFNQ